MAKKAINRPDSFDDYDAEETTANSSGRPYLPMDEANGVYDRGVSGLPMERHVSRQELLHQIEQLQEQARAAGKALAADGTIMVHGFQLTPTGLIAPDDISPEAWQQVGQLIFKLEGSIQWLIGDWIVYGGQVGWGDLQKLTDALGRDYDTLRNYANVSRNVKLWLRNHNLSYNHHRAVSSIKEEELQDYALRFAHAQGYSVVQFRQWIKLGMPETGLPSEADSPALPMEEDSLDPSAISQKLNQFFKRKPKTQEQKAEALQYIRIMRQHLDALEKECK